MTWGKPPDFFMGEFYGVRRYRRFDAEVYVIATGERCDLFSNIEKANANAAMLDERVKLGCIPAPDPAPSLFDVETGTTHA